MNEIQNPYQELTVGKIVARDYRKAMVFKKHNIDFCCGGKISVEEAAQKANVDFERVLAELEAVDQLVENTEDYNQWPLDRLVDHILEKHHEYVKNTMIQLTPMLNKVVMVHGTWRPELHEVSDHFNAVVHELTCHMYKEEEVLFPAIKRLVNGRGNENTFGSVQNPIRAMEHEHDVAGELMKRISVLTDGYALPKGACATYTVVYKVLKEFEDDLHEHIHLENNILFPKAIALEGNHCEL